MLWTFVEKIHPLAFFVGLAIGILYVYLRHPKPHVIIKYPTVENAGLITYIDKASNCYTYEAKEVNCPGPDDAEQVREYPIQSLKLL